jgi:hypothetical protein
MGADGSIIKRVNALLLVSGWQLQKAKLVTLMHMRKFRRKPDHYMVMRAKPVRTHGPIVALIPALCT